MRFTTALIYASAVTASYIIKPDGPLATPTDAPAAAITGTVNMQPVVLVKRDGDPLSSLVGAASSFGVSVASDVGVNTGSAASVATSLASEGQSVFTSLTSQYSSQWNSLSSMGRSIASDASSYYATSTAPTAAMSGMSGMGASGSVNFAMPTAAPVLGAGALAALAVAGIF